TGSMYLLEVAEDYRILIDCGFDMERERSEAPTITPHYKGSAFPFDASLINVVVLSHAHIDHSGNLPNLVREGFEGQIVCTAATYSLTQLLLSDSAALHQKRWKKYHKQRIHKKEPVQNTAEWYTQKHVNDAEEQFFTLQFNRRFQLTQAVYVTLIPVGHLLGAAAILLEVEEAGTTKKLIFSGDIGRKNYPLLPDPDPIPAVDYMLCETTYGARRHALNGAAEDIIQEIIYKACVEITGRLIIPAFSVGRTQAMLYTLNKLSVQGKLPPIKVFADSPLAYKSTQVYNRYVELLDDEAKAFFQTHHSLFDFENLIYVADMKTSRAISNHNEPCIIISSSGMVQGGRVENHVKVNIQNPYATILMIGYAAEGTLGRQLLNSSKVLEIKDKTIPILANVAHIDIFSGHGDQEDLLNFVRSQNPTRLKKLFLIHGETSSMETFKEKLQEEGYQHIEVPSRGKTYVL
ncbi:MAG: MBL fold metallo-hydrolase, partial [Bacteroidota bacterium]